MAAVVAEVAAVVARAVAIDVATDDTAAAVAAVVAAVAVEARVEVALGQALELEVGGGIAVVVAVAGQQATSGPGTDVVVVAAVVEGVDSVKAWCVCEH